VEKTTLLAIVLFICLPFFSETASFDVPNYSNAFTIVIDAGHGGKDSGALGSRVKEKDIALKLALKLGQYISSNISDVRVLYTRTTDKFVPLHQRISLANASKADVFFSIHCNAMMTHPSSVNGTETYVMGLHKATENLNVAKRENKVVLLEQDYSRHYGGYDPNSSEGHIMLSMFQNAYLSQSMLLAEKVESQFKNKVKRKSRGVKQAGFVVLKAATMPSVLVETGFLSNTAEEAYLNSEKGQTYIASAMYRAVKEYKTAVESNTIPNYRKTSTYSYVPPKTSYKPKPKSNSKAQYRKPTAPYTQPQKEIEPPTMEVPSIESMYPTTLTQKKVVTKSSSTKVLFRVQLASSPTKTNLNVGVWPSVKGVECLRVGTTYKCLVGNHNNLSSAVKSQTHWRANGFKDAFVVAFRNGKKISVAEARQ